MSKYIPVVDLPDDNLCNGCPMQTYVGTVHGEAIYKCNIKEKVFSCRPSDCPLIPVDRVIWKMNYLNDQENITGSQATAWCERVLRDELGVTE